MNAVAFSIVGLFALTIGSIVFLKWSQPDIDVTFLGMLASMVMGMAAFIALHFKQQIMEKKMDDVAEKTVNVAKELKEENKEALTAQTETLTKKIDEVRDA